MSQIPLGVAFIAGVLSFISPCLLPLVPGYISFISGISLEELRRGAGGRQVALKAGFNAICFVLGFSVIFITLGASASIFGRLLASHMRPLTKLAGVFIIILGIHLLGILKLNWLSYSRGIKVKRFSPGPWGSFFLGLAFAFGWTPCVGPILASILLLTATGQTLKQGVFFLTVYSLGIGVPFVITAFGVGLFVRILARYRRFIRWGEVLAGLFLVILGLLIFLNRLDVLLKFIPPLFYKFSK
jgi:cytochrome c-type biogenesis protein